MKDTTGVKKETIRDMITAMLEETGRPGTTALIGHMDEMGFFESPCSGAYHLAELGGLARHSLNVYMIASEVSALLETGIEKDSLIITCLLHDLGKAGQFGKPGYVPNMVKVRATKANPNPEPVQSEKKPFAGNSDLLPVAHETRSIVIASQYINLTEEEQFAILYHNGMYGTAKYDLQGHETPLQMILHFADMWASRVVEKEEEKDDEA